MDWRAKTGRIVAGVEIRVVDEEGAIVPNDGTSVGEFEVRGPWITASYYGDPSPDRFHDGWLRTGDVGSLDDRGYMQISDRTKDVIKSGGEWISSVELENAVMAHPGVYEAAVIGVPDERWDERPLVVVVAAEGAEPQAAEILAFLSDRVARLVVARALELRLGDPQDLGGQVRQEGAPGEGSRRCPRHPRGGPAGQGRLRAWAALPWWRRGRCCERRRGGGPAGVHRRGAGRSGHRPAVGRVGGHPAREEPDPALMAEERRLTRARRAVEKAVVLLRPAGAGDHEDDDGAG